MLTKSSSETALNRSLFWKPVGYFCLCYGLQLWGQVNLQWIEIGLCVYYLKGIINLKSHTISVKYLTWSGSAWFGQIASSAVIPLLSKCYGTWIWFMLKSTSMFVLTGISLNVMSNLISLLHLCSPQKQLLLVSWELCPTILHD